MTAAQAGRPEPVWVGTRLRPVSQAEKQRREAIAWKAKDKRTLRLLDRSEKLGSQQAGATFAYDAVFGPECTTEEVYSEAARDRVLSAMQGLNATLFVYGQTGSGKTYTMNAVVRLSAADIFEAIEESPDREFLLKLTAFEIYNEKVRDLLVEGADKQNLSLVDDPERGVVAEGCTDLGLESVEQLAELLKGIEARRTVRDTRMNAESSRSHQILRLYIESRPASPSQDGSTLVDDSFSEDLRPVKVSTINFVDLAGSERGTVSGQESSMERVRQTEGSAINKSLLTLGNVIRALGESKGRSHVPFRDSKLTRMLQPSLGGNSRTAIICTLSPAASAVEMSRAALHFANAAKRVTMQPVVNEVLNERARIKRLQSEIDSLRRQLATKDFAEEAAQLSAALREKEQEVRLTAVERDHIQKRLQNLERLILRAEKPNKDQRRSSWSDLPRAGRLVPGGERQTGPLHMSWASPSSSSSATPPVPPSDGHSKSRLKSVSGQSDRLLLDCLISPTVRQKATPSRDVWASIVDDGLSRQPSPEGDDTQAAALHSQRIRELQAPTDEEERAALAALKAEVRCISRNRGVDERTSTTMGRLKSELNRLQEQVGGEYGAPGQEETVAALQAEVARLEAAQSIQRAADSALDSLQDKIAVLKLSTDSQTKMDGHNFLNSMPSWFSPRTATELPPPVPDAGSMVLQTPHAAAPSALQRTGEDDDVPLMASPSGSPYGGEARRGRYGHGVSPADSTQVTGAWPAAINFGLTPEQPSPEATAQWYKAQLRRMQSAFREAAAKDVEELRAALEQQRVQVARLECQKQLLLKQVLRTELRLEESQNSKKELAEQLEAERKHSKAAQASAAADKSRGMETVIDGQSSVASSELDDSEAVGPEKSRSQLSGAPTEPPLPAIGAGWQAGTPKVPLLKLQGDVPSHMLDTNDSWNAAPSVENMLPKIVELWDMLHVPLIHRSRFYLAFRGREAFYFEAEKRRLAWLQSEMGNPDDPHPLAAQAAKRALARNFRKLDWERKWLAQQVKWDFSPEEREEMFLAWNIHRESKQRKLQLIKRLWSAETLREVDGMERSAELVMRLNGSEATEGMFDLVFGRNQGESMMKTMLATGGSMLAKIATPLRQSSNGSPAGVHPRRKSFLSSIAQQLTPRGRASAASNAANETGTPLRHGSMAWTPRGRNSPS